MTVNPLMTYLILAMCLFNLGATRPLSTARRPSPENCIQLESNARLPQGQDPFLYVSVYDAGSLVCDFAATTPLPVRRDCLPGYTIEISVNSTSDPMAVKYTTPTKTVHLLTEKPDCESLGAIVVAPRASTARLVGVDLLIGQMLTRKKNNNNDNKRTNYLFHASMCKMGSTPA
ncbi:hypothetical protein KEM54_005700 [Ascosphaera aggregata]|nr:hypothetical protein KEM54_005700 [Ascosphaera aggregata]